VYSACLSANSFITHTQSLSLPSCGLSPFICQSLSLPVTHWQLHSLASLYLALFHLILCSLPPSS
jgi:hypothetical protein